MNLLTGQEDLSCISEELISALLLNFPDTDAHNERIMLREYFQSA
jgi:hypothetical protein